ncbi:MAG: hypothetical protein MJZ37_04585 [Bacilli bacterium]|nr:hypothetical protein [Bacilli bacterium]
MVMKDKLEKFGHKRGYYAARSTFFGFIVCLCVFSMVAIPTYIVSRTNNNATQVKAAEEDDTNDTEYVSVNDNK